SSACSLRLDERRRGSTCVWKSRALSPVSLLALSRSGSASETADETASPSLSRALSVLMTVPWSVSKPDGHYSLRAARDALLHNRKHAPRRGGPPPRRPVCD